MNARNQRWKDITTGDLKIFFGLLATMGLVRKSRIEEYWSVGEIMDTPFFRKCMSRNQFQLILSNFHLADNNLMPPKNNPDFDPLYKLRPFVDMCRDNFRGLYYPERDIAVDEGGVAWKGRGGSRVYNPRKPNKFQMKMYQVCESTSGYVVGFEIYTGKSGVDNVTPVMDVGCTKTTKLVMRLLHENRLLGTGHCLYTDNYYTSPELAQELYLKNTFLCGTVRGNRKGLPAACTQAKLKRGETVFRRSDVMLALKWRQKKNPVYMLSTIHEATEQDVKLDFTKKYVVTKPTVVIDYTNKMLGVDLNDQMLSYYCFNRRTVKWWRKMVIHLFNMILTNSYVLHKKFHTANNNSSEVLTHAQFLNKIVHYLVTEGLKTCSQKPNAPNNPIGDKAIMGEVRLIGRHFPSFIQDKEPKRRKNPSRMCHVCLEVAKEVKDPKERHWTSFWCSSCQRALCVGTRPCFEIYHTEKKFLEKRLEKISVGNGQNGQNGQNEWEHEMDNINAFLATV